MRFLVTYLVVYFALIAGACVALWWGGVFSFFSPFSILLGLIAMVGLGVLLAVVWRWRPGRARS